jgi:hypothetical protein
MPSVGFEPTISAGERPKTYALERKATGTCLYNVVVTVILKGQDLEGNISTRLKQCSSYAEDILINTSTKESLIDTFQKLKNQSVHFGLFVNEQNAKYLRCSKKKKWSEWCRYRLEIFGTSQAL